MKKTFLLLLLSLITILSAEECCNPPLCAPPTNEAQCLLFSELNCESQRLYNSLDCEGRNRALELSRHYSDKNLAIQEAAKEMAKRRQNAYPNQDTYRNRTKEQTGQDAYIERFGA